MEVTRDNFEAVLTNLTEVFENAQFFTIDTEFTGLRVPGGSKINCFDTLEDLYLEFREAVETFMVIQVGLAAFFYDEETGKYTHAAYNFYVYPSSYSDVNFVCNNNSIKFLNNCGFDFNKLFKNGIPYLREEEVDVLIKKVEEKYEKDNSLENSTRMKIPEDLKSTINEILEKIKEILTSDKKGNFEIERHNSFIRKLIYNAVFHEFGTAIFMQTNKDESITVAVGLSPEEIKEKQEEFFNQEKNEIYNEIGFSKVVKLLAESNKLIIGHNFFMDLLFLIRQFLVPLPDTYKEFKELVKFTFPKIIDTKYMAASEIKDLKNTSLGNLLEHLKKMKVVPEVDVIGNGVGCKITDEKFHEASFDAYLTGLCFLATAKCLGNANSVSNAYKNLPESPLLHSVLNKLYVPKLQDVFYINLGGADIEPDRRDIFHLTFPKEWTRDNINNLFKECGCIQIYWINSTSAFIRVKKECLHNVESSLRRPNSNYKLISYEEFKSLGNGTAERLLKPITEKTQEKEKQKTAPACNTSFQTNSGESLKRKKIEEDIGEVIERPPKKIQFVHS